MTKMGVLYVQVATLVHEIVNKWRIKKAGGKNSTRWVYLSVEGLFSRVSFSLIQTNVAGPYLAD